MRASKRAQEILTCLGEPSRFRVLLELRAQPLCVGEVAQRIGLSQPGATRHLQAMQRAGLVEGAREGKRVVFRLRADEPAVIGLVDWAIRTLDAAPDEAPEATTRARPGTPVSAIAARSIDDFLL